MKKLSFLMLALLLCSVKMFAIDAVDVPVKVDCANISNETVAKTHTFTGTMTVSLLHGLADVGSTDGYNAPNNLDAAPLAAVVDRSVTLYYTTDGSDPKVSTTRKAYYDYQVNSKNGKATVVTNLTSITLSATSVIRTAVLVKETVYEYAMKGKKYQKDKGTAQPDQWLADTDYQQEAVFVCYNSLPAINLEGGSMYGDVYMFTKAATVSFDAFDAATVLGTTEDVLSYVGDLKLYCSLNGGPATEWDGNPIVLEDNATLEAYYSVGTIACANATNEPSKSESLTINFEKVERTSVQTAICDNAPGEMIFTKGFCIGQVGDYSFFSDGSATLTVKGATATVGNYYFIDGVLVRNSADLAGLTGVIAGEEGTFVTEIAGVTGQTPDVTAIDPAYLNGWMNASVAGAVVNGSMVATYEGGKLMCGGIEVTPLDASALADAYYSTPVVVKGTLYGRDGDKALFDIESYAQATPRDILALANPVVVVSEADSPFTEQVDAESVNFIGEVTVVMGSFDATAQILYTTDGTNPTFESNAGTVTPTGTTKAYSDKLVLTKSATVKAIAVLGDETSGDISVLNFKKLEVESIEKAKFNTPYGSLALVGGKIAESVSINGTSYAVLQDATGTMLVESDLDEGLYLNIGGKFIFGNSDNLNMAGFDADKIYIKPVTSYDYDEAYKPLSYLELLNWRYSTHSGPKTFVEFDATVDPAAKTAEAFGSTMVIIDPYNRLASSYKGKAKVQGTFFGFDENAYFLLKYIVQEPEELDDTTPIVWATGFGVPVSENEFKFIEQATIKLEDDVDGATILYTTDGTNPSYTVSVDPVTGERSITLTGTTKEYTPGEELVFTKTTVLKTLGVLDGYDNGKIECITLTKMEPETVQTVVMDYSKQLEAGKSPLVLTKGFVTYVSPTFLVIDDGTSTIKVNKIGFDLDAYIDGVDYEITDEIAAGDYVLIGGNLKKNVGGLIGIKKNYIARLLTQDELPVTEPVIVSAENLAKWAENYNSEPIVNVIIPAEYVSGKKATVGEYTLELRGFDADTIPAPYAGAAMVYGTIIGRDKESKTVFVRTTRVDQAPEKLETATPIFTIGKDGEFYEDFDSEEPELTKFIEYVTVSMKSEYDIPDWNVQIIYTLDGTTPTFKVDENGDIVPTATTRIHNGKELDIVIEKTCTLKAITLVGAYPTEMVVRDFEKLEPVSAQTFFFDTWIDGLALTKGLVLKNIEYDGNEFSVVSDGTGSFIVRNAGLEEGNYLFLGGFFRWNDGALNGMSGLNADEEPGVWHDWQTSAEQFSMRPTYVSPENLAKWTVSMERPALYNVALKASALVAPAAGAESTTATVTTDEGDEISLKLIGNLEGYDPTLFDGEAIIEGIVFGFDKEKNVLVYVTNIIQKPAVILGEPDINIPFEYAVDASEAQEVTFTFHAEDMILNDASIDPTTVKGDVTWSLRTRDGRAIKTETLDDLTLTDENIINLEEGDINTGSEYIVTIDNVVIYAHEPLEMVNAQDGFTMSKKFTTEECYVTDAVMSYFPDFTIEDPDAMTGKFGKSEFTITVLGAKKVEVNKDAVRKIKIYNTVDNSITFAPNSVVADGNKLTFNVSGLDASDPYTKGLRMGMYKVLLPAEALFVDGFYNPERITFNLTVGLDEDKARLELMMDIDKCLKDLDIVPMGVNIFQFTPKTCETFLQEIKNAWYAAYTIQNNFEEKERLEKANKILDDAYAAFTPTYPAGNQTYIISISEEGHASKKYLNIDGDVPVISETPSYIQFHAVNTINENQADEPYCWKTRTWYLYNTPTRRYLGYATSNDEAELYLTDYPNNKLDDFYVLATHFNEWIIGKVWGGETPYDKVYFSWLMTMDNKAYLDESKIRLEDYEKYIKENEKEPDVTNVWYIEEADDPNATPAVPGEEGDESGADATAISSAQAASMNAEFFSTSGTRLQAPKKGINIVKMSDGSVRKVYVK